MKIVSAILLSLFLSVNAQVSVIDSLDLIIINAKTDSSIVKNKHLKFLYFIQVDSLELAAKQGKEITEFGEIKSNIDYQYLGVSCETYIFGVKKQREESNELWKSLLSRLPEDDTIKQAKAHYSIGLNYYYLNDFSNALKFFFKSINYYDLLGNSKASYQWVVYCYSRLNDMENAAKFNTIVIDLAEKDSSFSLLGKSYISQGYYLMNLGRYIESYQVSQKAINVYLDKLKDSLNGELGVAYGNVADIYLHYYKYSPDSIVYVNESFLSIQNKESRILDSARYYIDKSARIAKEYDHDQRSFYVLFNYGDLYYYQGKIKKSEKEFLKCYQLTKGNSVMLSERKRVAEQLYKVYKKAGEASKALKFHEEFIMLKDSLLSSEKQKELGKQEALFEFEDEKKREELKRLKQKAIDELAIAHKENIAKGKALYQKKVTYFILFGAFMISVFTVVILKRLKIARRQQDLIRTQKLTIENSRNKMLDSIEYSKNIQQRIFPTKQEVLALLPNSFVFFKPKDVVSGDFYWVYKKKEWTYFSVADCTGHGVPGAFMTLISLNLINTIIIEDVDSPSVLLERLHIKLKERLTNSEEDVVKHGLDIAMCAYNNLTGELLYSGLHNPLYIINKENELIEIKGDNLFLGISESFEVTSHKIKLEKGSTIYMSTDGFPDQKGGEKGKKYYYSRLRNTLRVVNTKPMEERRLFLDEKFEDWKGDKEQIDDVCVMGVKF